MAKTINILLLSFILYSCSSTKSENEEAKIYFTKKTKVKKVNKKSSENDLMIYFPKRYKINNK